MIAQKLNRSASGISIITCGGLDRYQNLKNSLPLDIQLKVGGENDYGALVVIASPNNYSEGELMRLKLATAEIKANLAHTKDGPRLYVFERDEKIARAVLKS